MEPRTIILASESKARHALLVSVRLPHTVEPSGLWEDQASAADTADPHAFVRRLAQGKARCVAVRSTGGHAPQGGSRPSLVLGCDTVIVMAGTILGKPHNERQANDFLLQLSGCAHQVVTGLCLLDADGGVLRVTSVESTVHIRALTLEERKWYLRTGEWSGAAGGYRVQGQGAFIIERIDGSYSNVVGLPLEALYVILSEIDYFGTR